jgi:Fungal protein kinase
MMNEDKDGPCWQAFLIDLDLAFMEERTAESGAPNKTGTKVFMSFYQVGAVEIGSISRQPHQKKGLA